MKNRKNKIIIYSSGIEISSGHRVSGVVTYRRTTKNRKGQTVLRDGGEAILLNPDQIKIVDKTKIKESALL